MADLDLVESFFQSIDTIVNKRIEVLPYDKTIQATIEENDEADYGVYVVNDGQTTFKAFSENTSYPIGATVYVSIPKGDFNEQKIIIGQVTDEDGNATPIGYIDPMESFLDITGNIYENEINSHSLTANGNIKETETLWAWKADENNNPFVGFDILGLQADFTSSVGRMQTILEGNYGLRLDVVAIKKSTQVFNKENKVYYSFKLDSDSFYGDPYNFETYYKQSVIFSLEDYEVDRIDAMRLVFYQDGNFIDGDHQLISSDINGDNLGVSNIVLKLGYNLDRYTEDTVLIYTFDPKTYVNQITDNIKQKYKNYNTEKMDQTSINNFIKEVNRKKIHCRWIHFDENDEITCYGQDGNTTPPEDVDIKWYRYHIVEQTSEKYDDPPGVFWEEVKTNANKFDLTFDPDFTEYHEIYKIVLWNPGEEGLKSKIENDDDYLEADRQCKALLNMHHNFDPLELIRRYCEDIKYTAWIINIAATQAQITLGTKESLTNIQTAYAAKDYDKVISTYNDVLASSTAGDQAIGICLIEKQTNFFKNWMTNFKTYQLRSTKSSVEIMNKIRADYQTNQAFIEEKYIELGFFNIIDNDWATYCLPRIQSLMQSFINENPNQYTIASYNIDLSAYNIIMNQFERVLNEVKKDANTRNYTTLKNEFDRIGVKLGEQEESYYYRWFGTDENGDQANEPKDAWLNTFPAEQVKFEQVYIYGYCQTLYDKNDEIRNDIETTIRGEGAHILSNELEFLNEDPEVALVKLQTIKNLKLEVDVANDNGVYLFYNDDGSIINKSQASLNRKITAKYTTFLTGDSRIDTAEKIVWKFPKISTMIQPPAAGQEYNLYDEAEVTAATFPYGQYYTKNFYSEYTLATTYDSAETYFKRNNTEVTEDNDYIYITKYAPLRDKTEYGVEEASSTEISFRVKEFYVPSARNNTIYCEITKNNKNLMAESTLTFGVKGVIGTDYTFILQLEGNVDHVPFNGPAVNVITKLYDYEGKDISEKIGDIEFSWESQGTGGLTFTKNGQKAIITTVPGTTDITKCAHYILKAKITNGVVLHGKNEEQDVALPGINSEQNFWVKLTAYLPIVVERENFTHTESINGVNRIFTNSISRYEGATDITYDSTGVNPSYYKDPFNIWYWDNIDRQSRSFQNVDWSIIYGPDTYEGRQIDLRYYPWMNNTNALTVPSMYLENNGKQISVSAEINGVTVFIMPLHVYIRSYTSALLNSWNGGLTLDKENGTIMSAMMGAGYKDDVNRFYGILMGRMLQVNGERDLTNEYYTGTGLYGYHQGQKSFGLNVNGKAFFGKSGKGQILFDGNSGEIKSGNYATPPISGHPEGTRIDLDDGTIDIRGHYDDYYRTQASVFMSTGDNGKDYFCITSDIGTKLLKISPSDENNVGRYFLQSDNFYQEGDFGSGVKFDLSNGRLIGYDFSLTARQSSGEYAGSYIRLDSGGSPFLVIHQEYYGEGTNLLYASNNDFILKSPNGNMTIDVGNGYIMASDFYLSAGGLILSSAPMIMVEGGGCSFIADDSNVIISSENLTLDAAEGSIDCSGDFTLTANDLLISSGPLIKMGDLFYLDDEYVSITGPGTQNMIYMDAEHGRIEFLGEGASIDEESGAAAGSIIIDSVEDHAIKVGTKFKVDWDGGVECDYLYANKEGYIGPFNFDSNSFYTDKNDKEFKGGGLYFGKQGFSIGRWGGGSSYFSVDRDGLMETKKCKIDEGEFDKCKITNAKIEEATIENNIKINDAAIKNGTISNATISNCTISKANIQEGTISGASISNGTITNAKISQGSISNASISNLNVGGEGVNWSTVNYLKGVASQSATAIRGVGEVAKEKVDVSVKVSTGSYVEAENDETRYIEIPTYSGEGISASGTTSIPYSVPKYKSGSVTYTAETSNQVVTNVEKDNSILALTKVTFNKGSGRFLCGSQGDSTDSTK